MPGPETGSPAPPKPEGEAALPAEGGSDFDRAVAEAQKEVAAENADDGKKGAVKATPEPEKQPEDDPKEVEEGTEPVEDEKSSSTDGDLDATDKVFIEDEKGNKLELTIDKVVESALKDQLSEGDKFTKDGKLMLTVKADGQEYEGTVSQLRQWASHGIHANERIREANDRQAEAEKVLAEFPNTLNAETQKGVKVEVERIVEALSQGIDPYTKAAIPEEMREGAEKLKERLQFTTLLEENRKLKAEVTNTLTSFEQRQMAEKSAVLQGQAQGALETVLQPFTQHFKLPDGNPNEKLYALFKNTVNNEVVNRLRAERNRLGSGPKAPEIPVTWFQKMASDSAKEVFQTLSGSIEAGVKAKIAAKTVKPQLRATRPTTGSVPPPSKPPTPPPAMTFSQQVDWELAQEKKRRGVAS